MTRRATTARRWTLHLLGTTLVVLQAACADAPTVPGALEWLSGRAEWAALLPPDDLPTPSGWAARAEPTAEAAMLVARLRGIEADAERALARGDLERAGRLRREALSVFASASPPTADRALVRTAGVAIDGWMAGVRAAVPASGLPALDSALAAVRSHRSAAAGALALGDTAAAGLSLMEAAETIRDSYPTVVALHVVTRAEARVVAAGAELPNARRVRHLVRSAREALATGDPVRAAQRGFYALQLAGGHEVVSPRPNGR